MLDHINLPVSDLERSARFYEPLLLVLGLQKLLVEGDAIGFGRATWEFGIVCESGNITPLHLAFMASSQRQVRDFHAAALAAGAIDNGEPGIRREYGSAYFAAYVLDLDGHNIEAVCRGESEGD